MPESEADRMTRLATEALKTAAEMTDDTCRRVMIEIAAAYARLAEHVEQREGSKPPHDESD
jgi:hypothetical protein